MRRQVLCCSIFGKARTAYVPLFLSLPRFYVFACNMYLRSPFRCGTTSHCPYLTLSTLHPHTIHQQNNKTLCDLSAIKWSRLVQTKIIMKNVPSVWFVVILASLGAFMCVASPTQNLDSLSLKQATACPPGNFTSITEADSVCPETTGCEARMTSASPRVFGCHPVPRRGRCLVRNTQGRSIEFSCGCGRNRTTRERMISSSTSSVLNSIRNVPRFDRCSRLCGSPVPRIRCSRRTTSRMDIGIQGRNRLVGFCATVAFFQHLCWTILTS